jgi:hypothetical protein
MMCQICGETEPYPDDGQCLCGFKEPRVFVDEKVYFKGLDPWGNYLFWGARCKVVADKRDFLEDQLVDKGSWVAKQVLRARAKAHRTGLRVLTVDFPLELHRRPRASIFDLRCELHCSRSFLASAEISTSLNFKLLPVMSH